MQLLFIRHGQAAPYCANDAGRALTDFGQKQAKQTADYVLANFAPDLIISSPYIRAKQTAEILQRNLTTQHHNTKLTFLDSITPDDDPKAAVLDIANLIEHEFGQIFDHENLPERCIVIVCHMPIIAKLVGILTELHPENFELAECQVLKTSVFANSLATKITGFIPVQP